MTHLFQKEGADQVLIVGVNELRENRVTIKRNGGETVQCDLNLIE